MKNYIEARTVQVVHVIDDENEAFVISVDVVKQSINPFEDSELFVIGRERHVFGDGKLSACFLGDGSLLGRRQRAHELTYA